MQINGLDRVFLSNAALPATGRKAVQEPVDRVELGSGSSIIEHYRDKTPEVSWRFSGEGWIYEPTVGGDGTVYVGCGDDKVYAFNPDGSVKWKADAELV